MTFIRVAAATAMAAGGMALASPAVADDAFGTYSFAAEDGESATWVLTPCADDAPGCMRVSETGNAMRAPWSGDAHWAVGSVILVVQQPDAILCEDGTSVPGANTYSWDGTTLAGSASIITRGACGVESTSLSIPFKLTRLGAAEAQSPPAAVPGPPAVPGGVTPPGPLPPEAPPAPSPPLQAESTADTAGAPAPAR